MEHQKVSQKANQKMKKTTSKNWENEHLVLPASRGFVYMIINMKDMKLYVGKKKTVSERSIAVEGRKNRKRFTVESDWKKYWGSCKPLLEDIKKLGEEHFRKVILGAYNELHSVNYAEAEIQFLVQVLDEKTPDDYEWYNNNISIKAMRPPKDRDYIKVLTEIMKKL